jgi:NAD(P)-dependent dehydrogenase (short-subunit alcohol dehydrogenase family)
MPLVNPQNGPIMIEGAEPGDAVAVHIVSMKPRGSNPRGTCALIPFFGGLSNTAMTATLNEPLPEMVRKIDVDEEGVYWSKRVTLPYRPHIGTLSTSPEIDSISSLTPDNHGGNMDLPDMGREALPTCRCAPKARDSSSAMPMPARATARSADGSRVCQPDHHHIDLIKGWHLDWPRLENERVIMCIGSTRPLEDATRIAYTELVKWMEKEYGYDRWDAYMMLSQCGQVRLGTSSIPSTRWAPPSTSGISPPRQQEYGAESMDLGLRGLKAVVSGGTKGIGQAVAQTLADEGVNVSICARNESEVKEAVAALQGRGVDAFGSAVDVADGPALKQWVDESASRFVGLDIVVANVSALAIRQDEESWRKCFDVDMMGCVRMVDAAMPWLEKSRAAAIVAISSVSGREIDFAAGPYGTFKAALVHYVQGLAFHHATQGIRANTVSPGNTYFPGGCGSRSSRATRSCTAPRWH